MAHIRELLEQQPCWVAPLAGYTSWPLRMVCRSFGPVVAFTEMVKATLLRNPRDKTVKRIARVEGDRPLGIQLVGCDPGSLHYAASVAEQMGFDLVCWNAGCPVRKVLACGEGAAVLRQPGAWGPCSEALRAGTRLPLCVKTRLGWRQGDEAGISLLARAADAGFDLGILHGRYAEEGYGTPARHPSAAELAVRVRMPVMPNGDIMQAAHARMVAGLGYRVAMVGRGVFGRPWLPAAVAAELRGLPALQPPAKPDVLAAALRHAEGLFTLHGSHVGILECRRAIVPYLRDVPCAAALRRQLCDATSFEDLREVLVRAAVPR